MTAVIDNNDLKVCIGLIKATFYAFCNIGFFIVGENDDGEERRAIPPPPDILLKFSENWYIAILVYGVYSIA